jgi:trigger factor
LKIEKEFRDDHQVKLTVEMDSELFERAKRRAARQIAKRVKIPGFRPGKAPYGVILRQVGEGHIVEQALDLLVDEQYPEIIKAAEIEPYGPGKLDNVPELDPPTFEFIVPLDVEVELGDYTTIQIPFEIPETGDEEVESAIEQIRSQNASRESVDRPAEVDDIVFMRVSGIRTDLEDEEEATIVEERFSSATIREDENEEEWPFSGFSKELIGLSTDEEKTITYRYPDDHEDEPLQGAQAEYKVVVTNIQTQILPDVDDELAKTASEFDTLDEWKNDLTANLEERNKAAYAESYDDQIVDEIIFLSTIKFPPQIIENEKEEILRGLEYRLSQQGITKDIYLQIRGLDEEGLGEEIAPVAEERVKRALVLMEIAKTEEIKADPDKVKVEMGRTIQAISSTMTPNDAKKFSNSEYIPSLASNIVADLLTQSTMDFLRAMAKGEPWPPEGETAQGESDESEPAMVSQPEGETASAENETVPETETDAISTLELTETSPETEVEASSDDQVNEIDGETTSESDEDS